MVRWPEDHAEIEALRSQRLPRLLFVGPGESAPVAGHPEEDWIRTPASSEDVGARVAGILARTASASEPTVPLVAEGRLVIGEFWVALSPIEEHMAAILVGALGDVVPLEQLAAGPGGHTMTPNAVRVHVMRLRRRIRPIGLAIGSVHGRGYVLEASTAD